ncbi:hypothetical protein STEG23_031660 [Scotinomys teguina]
MWSILEKVPWGAEKKQKDGSCFHIHSVNLCLFIGKIFFNDFVEYVFCAFEFIFFSFFCSYYLKFIYVVYYIDRLSYVEPSMHLWDKAYLVMVDNLFDVFLESVCQYFIEYFCINVHEGDCCYISNFISDFINLDDLSLPFEKVPRGAEKKQKDGSCFRIHSINLCLFIHELRPLILRDVNDQGMANIRIHYYFDELVLLMKLK